MKINDLGRSMIEILGVLAIVGILSVGAISGYSKAMFKYKLIKTAEDYTTFFQEVLPYKKELEALRGAKAGDGDYYWLTPLLDDMQLVPKTWSRTVIPSKGQEGFIDRMGNYVWPFIRVENNKLNFNILITDSETSVIICETLYREVIMQFSDILNYTTTVKDKNGGSEKYYYGNMYCNGKIRKCIKDMSLKDIDEVCSFCASDNRYCALVVDF